MQTTRWLAAVFVTLGVLQAGCSGMNVDEKTKTDKKTGDKEDRTGSTDKVPGEPTKPEDEVKTKSGLRYVDQKKGNGTEAKAGKTVFVHYTGWLKTGKKFDSSRDRNKLFDFELGAGEVIKGWDEGVAGMKVGGKRKLFIPSELAYGKGGRGEIPPNADLIFEVELLEVK